MKLELLYLLISNALLCAAGTVPVLLWSNIRIGENSISSSLRSIPYSHFEQFFLDSFLSKNLLLFLQDELSIEDFSTNQNSFKNVQKEIERHNSAFLPNVENPSFLVNDLPNYGFKVSQLNENEFSTLSVKSGSLNAIIIKLPPTTQSSNRKYPLQKNDEIIRKILSKLDKVSDYIVMYTALRPVHNIEAAIKKESGHSIRKRSAPKIIKIFRTDCVLLHISKDFHYITDKTSYKLPVDKLNDSAVSECNRNESSIQFSYRGIENLGETSVKLFFGRKYRNKWIIRFAEVMFNRSYTKSLSHTLMTPNWIPVMRANESLVCAAPIVFTAVQPDKKGYTTTSLRVQSIQLQAFTNGAKKFSTAVDCVGYFSLAIWSGLLVSLLLISIVLFGVNMLMNVKTMDHFDDPKSKPLVPNTDD